MEYDDIRMGFRSDALETFDRVTLARVIRVTRGGEHDAERDAAVPCSVDRVQRSAHGVIDQLNQIGLEPDHDRLRFRVTHAAIELENFRLSRAVDHHARVQEPGEWNAVGGHAVHCRQDDLAHDPRVQLGRDDRRGGIGAHATGVGARVAVLQSFVILRGRQRQHVLAVDHDDEARLLARQKFLDDDAGTRIAHRIDEHGVDRRVRVRAVVATTTPLPAASPSALITMGARRRRRTHAARIGEGARPRVECRGDHERFAKSLSSSCAASCVGPKT